jgi:predicted amidohydrolase
VKPFAIAGLQMPVSATESNLEAMQHRLDALMYIYPWVQMVVFSELATFGPSPSTAQPLPGPAEEALCAMAAKHHLWFVPGSIYERVGKRVYNTTPVIDPTGNVVGRYRKLFPFEPDEVGVSPGTGGRLRWWSHYFRWRACVAGEGRSGVGSVREDRPEYIPEWRGPSLSRNEPEVVLRRHGT